MVAIVLPRPRRSTVRLRHLAATALLLAALPAPAHETLHEIRRGAAVAVRAYESDGDAVARARYEVYSPADPGTPWATGRTDGDGWLAFVPNAPGRWRVRVIEATGHGLDLEVEAAPPARATEAGPAGQASPSAAEAAAPSGTALALRPLLGVGAIGLVFVALFLAWRRKDRAPPP
jgi:nickel transport protein